jgi:A/G-specific adenine glycosylase
MVPESNPGDFNQAMMELGARICTPQNPVCVKCPISDDCKAFNQLKYVKELSKNGFFDEKKKKRKMADIEHGKKNRFMSRIIKNLHSIHRLFRLS